MTKERLKELWNPIAVGLFGKQGTTRYQRPHFAERPLDMMLEDLLAIPQEDWCIYAFSTEPLNGKFTDEQRYAYAAASEECGRTYAKRVAQQYGTSKPTQLARAMNMNVSYMEYPEKTDRVLFAEFREPNAIRIYMDAVRRARALLEQPSTSKLLTDKLDVSELLLAHELFHYVEEAHKDSIYTRTEKIELWSLGPVRNRSAVIAFSEIAAMAFAQELTGLPYSPYLLNLFLVFGYSPQEASALYETMMQCARRTPRDPGPDATRVTLPPVLSDYDG